MSVIPKSISLSIQRSVKIEEYKYNKIELGMTVEIQDEQPRDIIDTLYRYLDAQVDRLLKEELAKLDRSRQAVTDEMPFEM